MVRRHLFTDGEGDHSVISYDLKLEVRVTLPLPSSRWGYTSNALLPPNSGLAK